MKTKIIKRSIPFIIAIASIGFSSNTLAGCIPAKATLSNSCYFDGYFDKAWQINNCKSKRSKSVCKELVKARKTEDKVSGCSINSHCNNFKTHPSKKTSDKAKSKYNEGKKRADKDF